ncbi:MAG: hypothetical protein M0R51_13295 [Clostridia bacterium]|jgi:hypothetical protein|nr:hypothetical protein [Clostridia bacterium]
MSDLLETYKQIIHKLNMQIKELDFKRYEYLLTARKVLSKEEYEELYESYYE